MASARVAAYPWGVWAFLLSTMVAGAADVAIVLGCPSAEDGRVSDCQWRRAAWAARLYHQGAYTYVITSGSAVANPYVEADAIAVAMMHLGVPGEQILRERDAMHTDQNVAWSLTLAESRGFQSVLITSDGRHAGYGCRLAEHWTTLPCEASPIDYGTIAPLLAAGPPASLRTESLSGWQPLRQRERTIARATKRPILPPSWWVYSMQVVFESARRRPADLPASLRIPS